MMLDGNSTLNFLFQRVLHCVERRQAYSTIWMFDAASHISLDHGLQNE